MWDSPDDKRSDYAAACLPPLARGRPFIHRSVRTHTESELTRVCRCVCTCVSVSCEEKLWPGAWRGERTGGAEVVRTIEKVLSYFIVVGPVWAACRQPLGDSERAFPRAPPASPPPAAVVRGSTHMRGRSGRCRARVCVCACAAAVTALTFRPCRPLHSLCLVTPIQGTRAIAIETGLIP